MANGKMQLLNGVSAFTWKTHPHQTSVLEKWPIKCSRFELRNKNSYTLSRFHHADISPTIYLIWLLERLLNPILCLFDFTIML